MAREYTREIYLYINGKQVNNDIKSIRTEMTQLVNQQAKMIIGSKEYVEAAKKIKALKAVLNEHAASLKEVDRSWGAAMNRIGDQFNRFQTLGMAVIGATVGVIAGFMKTAEAANLFEERLDNLSALTGLNGKELEWLGVKAKETSVSITESGVRIKQSATDILDAYTKMGSQRPELLKDKEALAAVTEAAIILSEAGKMELEPATAALATTMNQFNLEARDANRIINTIAAGSKVGAGEIPYLTEVIEKSGTTANLMGISIEQMVGTIEAIAPKFAEARRAGTALDRVLLKMREKGIGMKDGVFDLNRAIDELRIRFANGESSAALFGVEQSKMGEILVMNQGDMNKYTGEVTNTSIAFEQAGKNTNNMAAKLAQAKNKVALMYIEIGEKLAPAVIRSTNAFNYFLKALMALPQFIRNNQILLVALLGAILSYNGALLKSIAISIADTAIRIKAAIVLKASIASRALEAQMTMVQATQTKALTIWQRAAVTVQWALNAAMTANPVGLVIAGITALVLALMYFSKNSRENLILEASKKTLTEDLTVANKALKVTYDEIGTQIGKLNELSVLEKTQLDSKLEMTIAQAEAELDLLSIRRNAIKVDSTKIKTGQFIGNLFNPDKLKEKARANALEAVAPLDAIILEQKDRIQSLRDQRTELTNILDAESAGDVIGSGTTVELESKLNKYTTALKNVTRGSEEYIRVQKKIKDVEAELAKERGAADSPAGEKFDRAKDLADIEKFHNDQLLIIKSSYARGLSDKQAYTNQSEQEDIRYLAASTAKLKALGQETIAEQLKIQDALIAIKEEQDKQLAELTKSLDDQTADMFKVWDEENEAFIKTIQDNPRFTDAQKQNVLEYQYWLETNAQGQRDKLKQELAENIISQTEYYDKIKALDKDAADKKLQNIEKWAGAATGLASAVGQFMEAQKNRELAAAGKDDKKKEAIEKKYAKRQKTIAIAQTLIEGILEIARINSNPVVNLDVTQALRLILTGLAVARTAGSIAIIQSQQFEKGKYPVMGANDKQIYQASVLGKVRTGIYNKPTLGLFSEKEPEIVIDGPTTRNIRANFPEILSAIQSARVNQYSHGLYPDRREPGHQPSQKIVRVNQYADGAYPDPGTAESQSSIQIAALLQANMQMMRQVILSHETPGTVSFKSIRDTQAEYEVIKRRSTVY
ncbi:MAG: phage tail tape measure protein [Bacteroidia bacterium]|nr:phage tail tape measure protein [Bacteroidia bacterium]